MNLITKIIATASENDVMLYVEDGKLGYVSEQGGLPESLKELLIEHKALIIDYLNNEQLMAQQAKSVPQIPLRPIAERIPLSYSQQRLWFIDQMQGGTPQYNIALAMQIEGRFNVDRAEQALAHIMERHQILRTNYYRDEYGPAQRIDEKAKFALRRLSLVDISEDQQQLMVQQIAEQDAATAFDLASDLMMRASFISLAPQKGVLLLNMHHIASDGWSMSLLLEEFNLCYYAQGNNQTAQLNPLPIQYADFAYWQRNSVSQQDMANQVHYWQEQLANIPQVHGLPLDKRRPEHQTTEGAVHNIALDEDLTRSIESLALANDATLYMLIHSVFSLLISRLSQVDDVVIGVPVANRGRDEFLPLIGFFVNTLVIRVNTEQNLPFRQFLAQVKATSLDAQSHQDLPFEQLVDILKPQRSTQYSPLFQIALNVEPTNQSQSMSEFTLTPVARQSVAAKFELTLNVNKIAGKLMLSFEYNKDLFDSHSIATYGEYLLNLLHQVVKNADTPIHQLNLLNQQQQAQLLRLTCGNSVSEQLPALDNLVKLFEHNVQRSPNSIAVCFEQQALSYQQLNQKVNQLARYLVDQGVGRDSLVGLSVSRSAHMVIGILAILKAGGAYVPLDPAYPQERLVHMIKDSGLNMVLNDGEVTIELPTGVTQMNIDNTDLSKYSRDDLHLDILPSQLAYVIYTSGSTGLPKGVMVEHGNVQRLLTACQNDFNFSAKDVWCLFHSYAFDFSVWELWGALAFGGRLVIVPQWVARSAADFYRLVVEQQVTVLNQTPTAFNQFSQQDDIQRGGLSLRVVIFGGEALHLSELQTWVKRHGDSSPALVNMYGITETTVHVTYRRLMAEDIKLNHGSLIGRALPDLNIYLLDRTQQLVSLGSIGEMYVGGRGVSRGYLNQPELTEARFIESPFNHNEKLYRTGDLARYLKEGELEYLGRIDEQVKIRGFRIELGEIEQQLSALELVDSCVVVVAEDTDRSKHLVAYIKVSKAVVLADDDKQAQRNFIDKVRYQLKAQLPAHMVPAIFSLLQQWPLTANGKVDKTALPQPDMSVLQAQYVAPQSPLEELLCEVWQSALGLPQVGIEDNFFSIGGDSILSIQIVSKLKALGYGISVKQVFESQTIKELAAQLQALSKEAAVATRPFIQLTEQERGLLSDDIEDAYPLSNLQAGMVFHTQLSNFNGTYHDIMADHIKCPWDEAKFTQALSHCVATHPILRTTFILSGARPIQQVFKSMAPSLVVSDIRKLASEQQQQQISQWIENRKIHVFDWAQGPLYQIHIFLRSDESFEFVLSFHHAIIDGWSRAAFSTQLYNNYEQLLRNQALPEVLEQWIFRDFIALEQQTLNDNTAAEHFIDLLSDAPVQQVPHKMAANVDAARLQQTCIVKEMEQLSPSLLAIAKRLGVPVQSVLLAVHFKVLTLLSGEQRAVSCVTHNGRPESQDAERGLGLFLNSLPLCLALKNDSWSGLIRRVANMSAENLDYRRYPLAEIQKQLEREFSEVTFNYTHFHIFGDISDEADHDFELLDSNIFEQTNFDFHVDVSRAIVGQSMSMVIHYNANLYEASQIEQIVGYYVNAFNLLLAEPESLHQQKTLLPAAELEQLQQLSCGPEIPQAANLVPWPVLFAQQVAMTPNAIAVSTNEDSLSYAALDGLSSRLAAYLIEMDVSQGSRVGLYLPRGIAQMVALLGVNKAGASYLPLEPQLPEQRLLHMINDAEVDLVLLSSTLMAKLPLAGTDVLLMDDVLSPNWLDEYSDSFEAPNYSGDDEAYILYTSGSTGRPKGVQISHRNLSHYLAHACTEYFDDTIQGAVVSSVLSFDATLTAMLPPLCLGKKVQLLDDGDTALTQLPYFLFEQPHNWVFKLTPGHLNAMVDNVPENRNVDHKGQHTLVIGGEQLTAATVTQWKQTLLPNARFINEYGPTETVVGTSTLTIATEADLIALADSVNVPIGKPIAGSRLYVVGAGEHLQPINCIGQLYIGGNGVGTGYLNMREQTNQSFVEYEGHRVYKTGDLARWLPSGQLLFVGRADEQIKIRGYRIELAEIRAQLLAMDEVQDAVVTVREIPNAQVQNQQMIVAYVIAATSVDDDLSTKCLSFLHSQLPEYMVPNYLELISKIPLTVNGKVNIQALPLPMQFEHKVQYAAPRTALEQTLCEVMQEVLGHQQVGINDNFFTLGGDSIRSIRMVTMLNRQDIHIQIKDIFDHDSVAKLAEYISKGENALNGPTIVEPYSLLSDTERERILSQNEGRNVVDAYPLSTLQSGMVFHTQMENFSGIYHDINAEYIQCPWNEAHFRTALAACIETHPILRTGFDLSFERPLQLVYQSIELPLQVENICALDELQQQKHIEQWTQSRKSHHFDWLNGPLFQINIFLRGEDRFEFVISFHHAVLDGWSRASFSTELYNYYERLLAGQTIDAAATQWLYRQYIALEQAALNDPTAPEYFAKMLEDAPTIQLPILQQRNKSERSQGHLVVEGFEQRAEPLINLARRLGVPVQVILMCAHYKALSVVSGQSKVLSCVVNNGRPEQEGGDTGLGLFLNSVPMALVLVDGSWQQLINQVARLSADSLAHRHYPLAMIQKQTGVEYAEVLFNYTHFHVFEQMSESPQSAGFDVLSSSGFEQTNFNFQVDIARAPGADLMFMSFKYDRNLYQTEQLQILGEYYLSALDAILADVNASHRQSLLDNDQRQWLTQEATLSAQTLPELDTVIDMFTNRVGQSPDAVAVRFEQESLTYQALDQQANRLAHYLIAHGVVSDTLVGLSVPRSLSMVVGIVAILKAGGAYVPLDPAYPAERLSHMMSDSGLQLLLCHSETPVEAVDGVTCLTFDNADLSAYPDTPVDVSIKPQQLAYVIYTSGSTGLPKGVLVEHGNVQRLLTACQADFNFSGDDVWCLFHSYAFDFSVWELWGALAFGGELVVVPQWVARSPEDFYSLVVQQKVTILNQTPTAFNQFSRQDQQQQLELSLRAVVFGGEALMLSELQNWVDRHGTDKPILVNMYGITETTVHVTYRRLNLDDIAANRGSLIGRPLSDLSVLVLNDHLEPVPVGTSGEMYVGGRGVSRGYLNRPELTADRFIDHPFKAGERLYRTGDLARYLKRDELEYLGRIDEQVKIRGFRIELGEIEKQLSALESIDSCVVLVREAGDNGKQLVAYLLPTATARGKSALDSEYIATVRQQIQQVLPAHMVPAIFVVIDSWPLTANGKINKKALPDPDMQALQSHYVAPRNAQEQLLCDIWQQILRLDKVGIEDNFFNIGGDSIVSIQIVAALKKHGLLLSVRQLFEAQTIAGLSNQLDYVDESQSQLVGPFSQLNAEERQQYDDNIVDAYPMSNLQSGMVFHTQLSNFNGIYHDIMSEHIKCPWHAEHFATALTACIERHPILRSGFSLTGQRPLQHVFASIRTPLLIEDISQQTPAQQNEFLSAWRNYRQRHEFDWAKGPLFQVNIFLRSEDSFEFAISFHHAILDGWSRAALTTELYNLYERLLAGAQLEPVEPEWIYRDFIALEQSSLNDPTIPAYFDNMLAMAPVTQIPHKLNADVRADRVQQTCVVSEMDVISADLMVTAKTLGVPVQALLLAVHFKVLSLVSGETMALSCVTHNGRPESEGADAGLGLFLNSLPMCLEVTDVSWLELIETVTQSSMSNLDYRRYPLAEIQKQMGREFGEVTFNYTHFHIYGQMNDESEHTLELLGSEAFEQTNFDFHVDISRAIVGQSMSMVIHYNGNLYEADSIADIARYYIAAFRHLLSDVAKPHYQTQLLSGAEREQLENWSQGAGAAQLETLPVLFSNQVLNNPDNIAMVVAQRHLSYAELDNYSSRLAAYLQEMDVVQGSRVGLYLPRGAAQLIAVLAVSKAGASYVPLEPGLPQSRLLHMIEDADVELVLLPSELMGTLTLSGVDVFLMDEVLSPQWLAEYKDSFEQQQTSPEDEAYVLYTSGSTGLPKGVVINHHNLSHYLAHAQQTYMSESISGSVVSSPLCFDATLTTLLAPLCVGKSVQLLSDGETALSELPTYLFESAENWLFKLTPAHLDALIYSGGTDESGELVKHAGAHVIVVGGEQLTMSTLGVWKGNILPETTFINEYGPTETTVGTSIFSVSAQQDLNSLDGYVSCPIGRPIAGSELYVVGAGGDLQPCNSVGELYIGGQGVAQGYLNLPEQSAASFTEFNGNRVYKTGDLARWLPTGELQFVGRRDAQVKLRGYRIELAEISNQILTIKGVKEAVVVPQQLAGSSPKLVAYVVAPGLEQAELVTKCLNHLNAKLPEYMVPSNYVNLEQMPLTPNGKVDTRSLQPATDDSQIVERYVAPQSSLEKQLCDIWAEVMEVDKVGLEDNFFSIGGDSILSIRIVSILKNMGWKLEVTDIFQYPTIAQLITRVEKIRDVEPTTELADAHKTQLVSAGKEIEEGTF